MSPITVSGAAGQTVYAAVWKIPSRRNDVQVDGIPDYVVPKPGVTYASSKIPTASTSPDSRAGGDAP